MDKSKVSLLMLIFFNQMSVFEQFTFIEVNLALFLANCRAHFIANEFILVSR